MNTKINWRSEEVLFKDLKEGSIFKLWDDICIKVYIKDDLSKMGNSKLRYCE